MTVVSKSIVVDAPRETIGKYYTDEAYAKQIYQNVYQWEPDDAWPAAGAEAKVGFKAVAMNVDGKAKCLAFDPETLHHVYDIVPDDEGLEPSHWEWTFDEDGGKTTVTVQIEYTVPGRILGPALDKLMVERQNNKLIQASLDNLKALAEGSAV
jgi:hypothetical protein